MSEGLEKTPPATLALGPTVTIYTPQSGQKTKVKVAGSATTGQICVLGKATEGGGPDEVYGECYSQPFPTTPDDPPPSATQGTCVSGSDDYNFIIAPIGGVQCNSAGTILNRVVVWVVFGSGQTVKASVDFFGQCGSQTECEAIGNIPTTPCGS